MLKINKNKMLELAQVEFEDEKYMSSLQHYALILNDYPNLEEAKIGVYLSDLGLDSSQEAQALFDYYHLIKDEKDDAFDIINNLMDTLDFTKDSVEEIISEQINENLEYEDGISYSDFQDLISSRGSFKRAFEDIMFSTKVIIRDKKDFIGFILDLSQGGFKEMALNYLDNAPSAFGDDQAIYSLYEKIEERE
jgi:predicted SAM-dependent methyltransferase